MKNDCEEIRMLAQLDTVEEATEAERRRVTDHAAVCASCSSALPSLRDSAAGIDRDLDQLLRSEARSIERIQAVMHHLPVHRTRTIRPVGEWLAAAAVLLVGVFAGILWSRPAHAPPPDAPPFPSETISNPRRLNLAGGGRLHLDPGAEAIPVSYNTVRLRHGRCRLNAPSTLPSSGYAIETDFGRVHVPPSAGDSECFIDVPTAAPGSSPGRATVMVTRGRAEVETPAGRESGGPGELLYISCDSPATDAAAPLRASRWAHRKVSADMIIGMAPEEFFRKYAGSPDEKKVVEDFLQRALLEFATAGIPGKQRLDEAVQRNLQWIENNPVETPSAPVHDRVIIVEDTETLRELLKEMEGSNVPVPDALRQKIEEAVRKGWERDR